MTSGPDPSHFARAVTALGDCQPVVAARAIYNTQGVKIIDKGVRVDSRLYERLTQHQLKAPLAESLSADPVVDGIRLRQAAQALLARNPLLAALLPEGRLRTQLLEELLLLPLPPAMAFQLTVLASAQPEAWQYALRSMLVAAVLAASDASHTRHDLRMLAAGGLLHDLGMLHVDPVLHRPQVELEVEQRRHLYAHPLVSVMLLERHHEYPRELLSAVMEHHESLDGSGYPRGLVGDAISRWGRMLGLTKLVATLMAPGTPEAALRLSVALRMNVHRYDAGLAREVERRLPASTPAPPAAGDDPLQTLREVHARLAAWPAEVPADLAGARRDAAAVVGAQCAKVLRVLADAGAGPGSLNLLQAEGLDDAGRAELALIAREGAWQLRVVARQARRRIRDSDGPLPPWLDAWLSAADTLCAHALGGGEVAASAAASAAAGAGGPDAAAPAAA